MSRSKKRNKRRAKPNARVAQATAQRLSPPKARLARLFRILTDISRNSENRMLAAEIPPEESGRHLMMFDASMLLRASNALKAVRILCEQAHWEFAAPILRQLFELVLNLEHLATQSDREAATFRYSKYGLLQTVLHQHGELVYAQKTGRPVDGQRLAVLEQMLEHSFPEFRRRSAPGTVKWLPSWSGHTARYLAEQSKQPLRIDQYDLLFRAWSEQAHAAPAAMMDNMFPGDRDSDQIVASDDAEIIQAVMMAVTLFFEVWALLPNVPRPEAEDRLTWVNAVIAEARKHGAPIPASDSTAES